MMVWVVDAECLVCIFLGRVIWRYIIMEISETESGIKVKLVQVRRNNELNTHVETPITNNLEV